MTSKGHSPLRISVVGAGIGRVHAAGIARMPEEAVLAAACALPLAEARRMAEDFGAASYTDDYEALLRDPELDAVDLCVPHRLHLPMALAAARAGKHILVEKPIARNLEEADRIIAAAREAGVVLMVDHNQRFLGHHAMAKRLIEQGAIGVPFLAVASVHVHGRIEGGFRASLEEAGGGTLIDSGVHRFDLLRWLVGDVESVFAQTGRFMQPDMEGEDCAVVALRFRSGAIGSFTCSWSAKSASSEESLQIFGPLGSIKVEDRARRLELFSEAPPPGLERARIFEFPEDQAESIRLAIAAFADSVRLGGRQGGGLGDRPPITGEDGRAALELAMASYRSAESGMPVGLNMEEA